MTDTIIELSEEAFAAQYPLRRNHLDSAAGWDNGQGGCLFETYGETLAFVRSQDPRTVWTLIDGDDGAQYVLSGFHLVNRLGYLISTTPVPEGTSIRVHIPMQSGEATEATAHTPEPWGLVGFVIFNPASSLRKDAQDFLGGLLAVVGGLGTKDRTEQLANARRICAAVNACQGISTEALERGVFRQLVEALEDLYCWLTPDWQQSSLGEKARAAIVKATGRAA